MQQAVSILDPHYFAHIQAHKEGGCCCLADIPRSCCPQHHDKAEAEIASLREQLAQAERERDAFANTIRLLTEENLTVLIPRMEAAEAQIRELVEWRRRLSKYAEEVGVVTHDFGTEARWHYTDQTCNGVYADGTTECDWLEAHKKQE